MKLTDRIVARLLAPTKGNRRTPSDADAPGLCALVTAGGWRGFVFRYWVHGRQRQMTIGPYPAWMVQAARHRAKELRRMVDQGIDPLAQEVTARAEAMTVVEFWEGIYDPLHAATKRWVDDIRSIMRNHVLPALGDRPIKAVDHADVAALHRKISQRFPGRANRALAIVSHMMTYAERPHVAPDGERIPALRPQYSNPCRGVARNHEEPRERFLTPMEVARLAAVLEQRRERVSVALVRFLLLTGARFGEAANATWAQFDFERGTWTKPSSHTKQRRTHVVPLSAPALALLVELRGQSTGKYLFAGPTGRPIGSIQTFWRSVTKQAEIQGVRIHDLRHSFASVLVAGGASLPLIGSLLGHTQVATTARYSHLSDDVQREAVERAAAVITGHPSAEVVPLRTKSR